MGMYYRRKPKRQNHRKRKRKMRKQKYAREGLIKEVKQKANSCIDVLLAGHPEEEFRRKKDDYLGVFKRFLADSFSGPISEATAIYVRNLANRVLQGVSRKKRKP